MSLLTSPPVAPSMQVRYWVLGWFCTLSMITYIDRVCIMQVQGEMQRDLGLSKEEFAWAFTAFALAYAMFEVPTGWLGDKLGSRKVLIRIVLCWLLFTALTGLVWGLISLLIVRFLFGAGEAGAYPNMARGARNWFPFTERGRAQGLIWTFGRWGGALAPVLIIALTYPFDHFELMDGWRGAFIVLGLLGVFWVIGFSMWFKDSPREHPGVSESERLYIEGEKVSLGPPAPMSWHSILHSRTLWCLSFMYFCSNAGWSFFITYSKPYLETDLGLRGWQLHLASGAPLFCGGIGCMLGGMFTDRQVRIWGPRWGRTLQGIVAYTLGGGFFLFAFYMTEHNALVAFLSLCMASFIKDFAMGASWATTIDIGHRYSGTVAGIMNTIGNMGTVVSPPLVMWLVWLSGGENMKVGLTYYAACFFVAAVCWLFINPTKVIVYSREDRQRLREEGVLN